MDSTAKEREKHMNEPSLLDKIFNIIMRRMVEAGQAPHYVEIAADLGVPAKEGRQALHALMEAGVPGWLYPGTDLIRLNGTLQ